MTAYKIVAVETDGSTTVTTFRGDGAAAFEVRGYAVTGIEDRRSVRDELRGQPKIGGLEGPMFDVDRNRMGDFVCRYETPAAYRRLSE